MFGFSSSLPQYLLPSVLLYSTSTVVLDDAQINDPNAYPLFKVVDSTIVQRIMDELDALGEPEHEGVSQRPRIIYLSYWHSQSHVRWSARSQNPYVVRNFHQSPHP